jgi:hypothetical protein
MLPGLENVYMDIEEFNAQIYGVDPAPAEVLANWVEMRQRKASSLHALTESRVRSLKTVFVQFYGTVHLEIVIETRERIKSALGENGVFVWRLKEHIEIRERRRQTIALKEDILLMVIK